MIATDSPLPKPPVQRLLKSPYFVFRTPDGLGTYFTDENRPLLLSPKEPLARFLALARLIESGTPRSIRYDFEPSFLDTARPMEFLPQSEIDAFAFAAASFYEKAHAATPRIVPHEKRLRAHFRLPDPDLEPDAYWVYGPAHDRRLLILWGAEFKAGTSVPVAPDLELKIPGGTTLFDKLQQRVMSWEARQREALRFAFDPTEPISRFLARPAVNASGAPVGVSWQGRTVERRQLRPLRRISTGECLAFERAARAFYDRGVAGGTPYEKEIRQALRLPDPDAVADSYFVVGKRLAIALEGPVARERMLPLVDHPLVPPAPDAPAAAAGAGEGSVVVEDAEPEAKTVSARLRARSISSALIHSLAAAAALAVLAAGFGAWKLATDHTAPRVVESADYPSALDDHEVVVKFSKPMAAKSIQLGAQPNSFVFGDDAAEIKGASLDPKDPSRIVLTTSPLADGKSYRLTVDALTDRRGNKLAEPTSVGFKYLDTVPPELKLVSAGENANQLVLVFSKAVAESSIARGGNYSVFALEAGGEGASQRIASGRLDPEDRTGRTVILDAVRDFVGNQPYRLESIGGVTDAAVSRNPVALPPKGLDFAYRDILPPRIHSLSASARRLELTVSFSKPVDPAAARDLGNYSAVGPDKSPVNFLPGSAVLDPTGRDVTLRLVAAPLHLGVYHLTIRGMSDRMGNHAPLPLVSGFEFADTDRSALKVASHSLVAADNQVDNKVTLTFNRALNPADAVRAGNYALLGRDRTPLDLGVVEARRVPDDPAQVILILSQSPTPGVRIILHATGLTDIFGQKPDGPIEYAFTPPGIPNPTEQVLDWVSRPVLRGDELSLAISEVVARSSALAAQNYVFNHDDARVRRVIGYQVKADPRSGTRRTLLVLRVDVPPAARRGLNLRVRNLQAQGLEFLGAQRLRPMEVAQP